MKWCIHIDEKTNFPLSNDVIYFINWSSSLFFTNEHNIDFWFTFSHLLHNYDIFIIKHSTNFQKKKFWIKKRLFLMPYFDRVWILFKFSLNTFKIYRYNALKTYWCGEMSWFQKKNMKTLKNFIGFVFVYHFWVEPIEKRSSLYLSLF